MFERPSSHHPYPVSLTNIDGSSQYGRNSSLRASLICSTFSKILLKSLPLSSSNHRSTGSSSGLYDGSASALSSKGQFTLPLRWLDSLSKIRTIFSSG